MGEKFTMKTSGELAYLFGDAPLGLTHRIDKLQEFGIKNFSLDFSFFSAGDSPFFRNILTCYERKKRIDGSILFNHKGGLK
jgi:hypothetical protein